MFTSGFTEPRSSFRNDAGRNGYLQTLAKARNCAITGSLVIAENDTFITDWFCISIREISIMTKTFVYAFWRRQGIHARQSKVISNIWVGKFAH
jgi:hypothetical protein